MIRIASSTALLLLLVSAAAQNNTGTISGIVSDSDGIVADATVEARNLATNEIFKTITDSTGYTLTGLPAGTYEIAVPPLGWRTDRYLQNGVRVVPSTTLELDIALPKGNLGVIGDDLAWLTLRNKYSGITGPTPRTADGRPDLSGVWQGNRDPDQNGPDALPWAAELASARLSNNFERSPAADCLPDPILLNPTLYKFVQTPAVLVQIFEYQPSARQVFLDGRPHPDDWEPSWMGHSVGRWVGDTLVIETIGFNGIGWLPDGYPHTEQMRVIERYSRPDLAHLDVEITIEDSGALNTPWEIHQIWTLAPGEEILEYICNENNKYQDNVAAD